MMSAASFGREVVVAYVAFEELRQHLVQPDELRVVELRVFRGNNLGDAIGPPSRDQDPPVPLTLHHPL